MAIIFMKPEILLSYIYNFYVYDNGQLYLLMHRYYCCFISFDFKRGAECDNCMQSCCQPFRAVRIEIALQLVIVLRL